MKILVLALAVAVGIGTTSLFAQCDPSVQCPREAVQEFIRWDVNGILLDWDSDHVVFSQDGWRKASVFFLRYNDNPPASPIITVISPDYSVDDISIQGSRAKIYFGFFELGRIDGSVRWHPATPRFMKYAEVFGVVLSSKRWETASNDKTSIRTLNPQRWLIDSGPPVDQRLSLDAAVKYIKKIQQNTSDAAIRANADATVAALEKLKR